MFNFRATRLPVDRRAACHIEYRRGGGRKKNLWLRWLLKLSIRNIELVANYANLSLQIIRIISCD